MNSAIREAGERGLIVLGFRGAHASYDCKNPNTVSA